MSAVGHIAVSVSRGYTPCLVDPFKLLLQCAIAGSPSSPSKQASLERGYDKCPDIPPTGFRQIVLKPAEAFPDDYVNEITQERRA
jgi:hypothetical protein